MRAIAQLPLLASVLAASMLGGCRSHGAVEREVWAEVDGHPIYRDQVESAYRLRLADGREVISGEQALSVKLSLLNELIDNQLLLELALKSRIIVSEAEIDHRIADLASPYSPPEFQKKLADQGLTPAGLREQVRQRLLVEKLLDRDIRSRLKILPAEVESYYREHASQFNVPETRYHLAQILVTPARDSAVSNLKQSDAVGRAAAERKVRMIEAQLRAGEEFGKLASEYSEDPATASGSGDMGFVPASAIAPDPRLRQAVNALRVGHVSGIIRDEKGDYHILKLLDREEAGSRPLSDAGVQKSIRDTLLGEREEALKAAYLEDLRNRAKIKDTLASAIVGSAGNPSGVR